MSFWTQNTGKLGKKWIIALVFKKKLFLCGKSLTIVIIIFTPENMYVRMYNSF
jgi:hypothetical protein